MISIHMNASSLLAQRQLGAAHSSIATSLERLSTGFKINRASDNAANLAISKGQSCQISGTTVAIDNALQGINLLDTADGALANMTEKVNRIRDLCLKSMNGTYSDAERSMMQQEVDKLTAEIYREKNSTTFNNIKLFEAQQNAPPDSGGGGSPPVGEPENSIQTLSAGATDEVAATYAVRASEKPYAYEIEYLESTGTQWIDTGVKTKINTRIETELAITGSANQTNYTGSVYKGNTGWMCIGSYGLGELVAFFASNTREGCTIPFDNEFHSYVIENGHQQIDDKVTNITTNTMPSSQNLWLFKGSTDWGSEPDFALKQKIKYYKIYENDTLIRDFIPVVDNNGVACMYDNVTGQFYYNQTAGHFATGPRIEEPTPEPPVTPDEPDTPDVPDVPSDPKPTPTPPKPPTFRAGDVLLQIGANSGAYNQLGIDLTFDLKEFESDISTSSNASKTLEAMDKLKELLVQKRSTVGAQRNRLESVINASSLRKENLSASYSTMMDTDFASETAKLTRQQILQQATSSLLIQANQQPALVLRLLGG